MIARLLAELADLNAENIPYGIDGCGVPTFRVPMAAFARALARFAGCGAGRAAHPAMAAHRGACTRIFDAMTSHPELVGGTGRFCTELSRAAGRPLLAKAGAEGFYAAAWRDDRGRGNALAAKAASGDSRSRDFAVTEALYQCGVLDRGGLEKLASFHAAPMRNHAGTIVGKMRSMFELLNHDD
jgi:L-asparaginase II